MGKGALLVVWDLLIRNKESWACDERDDDHVAVCLLREKVTDIMHCVAFMLFLVISLCSRMLE